MAMYHFDALEIDPVKNPAVLDTLSWDESAIIKNLTKISWDTFSDKLLNNTALLKKNGIELYIHSHVEGAGSDWILASIPDGQHFFLSIGQSTETPLGRPIFTKVLKSGGKRFCAFPAHDYLLNEYTARFLPHKGPQKLGATPRLGIGNRHSTTLWPGIWSAMGKKGFAANAIQNSVRELHRLETLITGTPSRVNHLYSYGKMFEGHTGSTFEGLYTYGVLSSLKSPFKVQYGADADHLQVKRGAEGTSRTKHFIDSSQFYSFYTIDVSDILVYTALTSMSDNEINNRLQELFLQGNQLHDLVRFHKARAELTNAGENTIKRFLCKYWQALNAMEELDNYLKSIKRGREFDLELSIDETPADFAVFDAITTNEELSFLLGEIERRQLGVTHIAPNFGVEKGVDYRAPGGLEGLEKRVSEQVKIADSLGLMLDCHSGDDLERPTRRVLGKASEGKIHYKLSPSLQQVFAKTLEQTNKKDFDTWWLATLEYAKENAEQGSKIAIESLAELTETEQKNPSAEHKFFREYNYGVVGKRDERGHFLYRSLFYSQGAEFQKQLDKNIEAMLCECASDLWGE